MFECFSAPPLRVQIMQRLHGTHATHERPASRLGIRARAEPCESVTELDAETSSEHSGTARPLTTRQPELQPEPPFWSLHLSECPSSNQAA